MGAHPAQALSDLARVYARTMHYGQRRLDGSPCMSHLRRVVGLLRTAGVSDERVLAAGWLHDLPEDCSVSSFHVQLHVRCINDLFGERVSTLVDQLTVYVPAGIDPTVRYQRIIERAKGMQAEAVAIKLADRRDNLSGIGRVLSRADAREYARNTIEFLAAVGEPPPAARSLAEDVEGAAREVLSARGASRRRRGARARAKPAA